MHTTNIKLSNQTTAKVLLCPGSMNPKIYRKGVVKEAKL